MTSRTAVQGEMDGFELLAHERGPGLAFHMVVTDPPGLVVLAKEVQVTIAISVEQLHVLAARPADGAWESGGEPVGTKPIVVLEDGEFALHGDQVHISVQVEIARLEHGAEGPGISGDPASINEAIGGVDRPEQAVTTRDDDLRQRIPGDVRTCLLYTSPSPRD